MSKSDAPVVVAETTTPSVSTGDHYNVWFGVRGDDLGLIAGVYVAHIIYTATINPAVPANVERVEPNAYNLGVSIALFQHLVRIVANWLWRVTIIRGRCSTKRR